MRLKEFIPEARRNPKLNPRHHTIDVLSRLYTQTIKNNDYISEDMPNLFASFTSIEKLGIHPKKGYYVNPIGVYAHPVKTILEDGDLQNFYAGTRSLVNVFQISGNVLNLRTVKSEQQNELFDQAWDIITKSKKFNHPVRSSLLEFNDVTSWWRTMLRLGSGYFAQLWNCDEQVAANKLFRTLGFTAIIDPDMYLITQDIKTQLIVLDVRAIKNNQTFRNLFRKTNLSNVEVAQRLSELISQYSEPKLKELMNQTQDQNERRHIEYVNEELKKSDVRPILNYLTSQSSNNFFQKLKSNVISILRIGQVNFELISQILEIINQAYVIAKQELYKNY